MSTQMTRGRPISGPTPQAVGRPSAAFGYALASFAVIAIWGSVVLSMIYSPDFVTGSQHEHYAGGGLDWLWGGIATGLVGMATLEGIRARVASRAPWLVLGVGVAAIWVAVALLSIFTPRMVTGTDPTMIPYAAWGTPIIGLVATAFVSWFTRSSFRFSSSASSATSVGDPETVARLNQLAALRDAGTITSEDFERKKADLLSRL
jgi:Short C-terminal domain